MGRKLYRSGMLNINDQAPEIASIFDSYALSAGADKLESYVARASAAFFCGSQAEAYRWTGWRLNEGLDASIYEYDVPEGYEFSAFPVWIYNLFLKSDEDFHHAQSLTLEYYRGAANSSFDTSSSKYMWETLIPLSEASTWEHRIVKAIYPL